MPITYKRIVQREADGTYNIGLQGVDENGKKTHQWKRYPAKPDKATFKKDFAERQKDGGGNPVVGTSLKELVDKWFVDREAEAAPVDETPADSSITFP